MYTLVDHLEDLRAFIASLQDLSHIGTHKVLGEFGSDTHLGPTIPTIGFRAFFHQSKRWESVLSAEKCAVVEGLIRKCIVKKRHLLIALVDRLG